MADGTRTCTTCSETRPVSDFAADARRKSGVRATCKPCDRAARAERRRPNGPKPGALVLVPNFPAAPIEVQLGDPPARKPVGDYAAAAERFIAALVPPAGDADALLVRSLRGLSELLDVAEHGSSEYAVRDATALVAKLIAVQRELAATRAVKRLAAPAEQPARRLASGQF